MSTFIKITDVTFLANYDTKTIKEPKTIILNTAIISKFSTEDDKYLYKDKICTVVRTSTAEWGFIVTETMEELLNSINK